MVTSSVDCPWIDMLTHVGCSSIPLCQPMAITDLYLIDLQKVVGF